MTSSDSSPFTPAHASELYSCSGWGRDFFSVNESGEVVVHLKDGKEDTPVSLFEVAQGMKERGFDFPLLLRFRDLLDAQIRELNEAFIRAIKDHDYQAPYRGVYPIKVNQQQQVIEEVTEFGRQYHYGLEAGSKPELLLAMAHMHDPEAFIICNGYKDAEFIDLALHGIKMGLQIVLVIEMPSEIELVIERSRELGIRPMLGMRVKLSTCNNSHWQHSSGENSVFGLTPEQLIAGIDRLRSAEMLDCFRLMHFHQGSQVADIREIRDAAAEAMRIYVQLVKEGAPMGIVDIGGGLGVDYDGTRSNNPNSRNYGLVEYAADIVDVFKTTCDETGITHPIIISESGRAIAAYYSVLLFNILDVNRFIARDEVKPEITETHSTLRKLLEVDDLLTPENVQECYNDAVYYREDLKAQFQYGNVSLRQRAEGNQLFKYIIKRIVDIVDQMDSPPEDLADLGENLKDVYYANFSLFQSLPDSWAIDQLFPVMPIHRLDEEPNRTGVIADITCDCDGRIDTFVVDGEVTKTLPLHELKDGEDYLLGVFLVGAYQETLGDLHNLMGDTHVASISVENGKVRYLHELEGDTVADVLSYVEYEPGQVVKKFRALAERSVENGLISAKERKSIMSAYEESIRGYTYFES